MYSTVQTPTPTMLGISYVHYDNTALDACHPHHPVCKTNIEYGRHSARRNLHGAPGRAAHNASSVLANTICANPFDAVLSSASDQGPNRGPRSRTCTDLNHITEPAPGIGESCLRDTRWQPTDPEHTRWLLRSSPPGHRPLELLDDGAARRRVKRFPKLQGVPQGPRGQAVVALVGAFDA
ncbi:hypothetical protein BJV77DRAFT_732276 [Russula vinacea]|nr:hypothetical protein BJV77DRAFT_732276 [Russula vinacea]